MKPPKLVQMDLGRVRDPEVPARTNMDDELLADLVDSIKELGLLQPLGVRDVGDGYVEVIYGHRRLSAARLIGLPKVPCLVWPAGTPIEAAKLHENVVREQLSATDEARTVAYWYAELGEDVDRVCQQMRRSRAWVERRILLTKLDPELWAAVEAGDVPLGVAEEFAKMTRREDRLYYLDFARRTGCTIPQARIWRTEANARAEQDAAAPPAPPPSPGVPAVGGAGAPVGPTYAHLARPHELSTSQAPRQCMFCQTEHEEWRMFRQWVCAPCADQHLVPEELKPKE